MTWLANPPLTLAAAREALAQAEQLFEIFGDADTGDLTCPKSAARKRTKAITWGDLYDGLDALVAARRAELAKVERAALRGAS